MGIRYLDEQPTSRIRYLDEGNQKPKGTFRTEVVGPIASGLSTLAFGIPKYAMQRQVDKGVPGAKQAYEFLYPEQQTAGGKTLRVGSEIGGFLAGGIGKTAMKAGTLIPRVAKEGAVRKIGRAGVEGGAAGFLAPRESEDFLDVGERVKEAGIGSGMSAAFPAAGTIIKSAKRGASIASGVKPEVYDEVAEKGFRKVLQKKYYDKKMPQQLQVRIEQNIENLKEAAGQQYDDLVTPLKAQPFDMPQLRGDVIKIANRVKKNPFETDVSKLDNAILDGIVNKAQVNNLGDALDLRRSLDDVIYSNKGEIKSTFGKQVRNLLNKELHKNPGLKGVDQEWSSLQTALREGKKATSETGENFLKRWSNLPEKQKQILVRLERQIGGEPFIEDLTNWSLAQDFVTTRIPFSIPGVVRSATKPILRGALRSGEAVSSKATPILNRGKGRLIAVQGATQNR